MNKMKKIILLFSLLLMILGITSCKGKQEEKQYLKKVDNIIQAIDTLPDVVTLDDDIKVREISYSYEALPNQYKEKVTNYQKLQDAIFKIDYLKKEQEYQIAANSVIRKINILPSLEDIRIEDKELVIDAREKYEELEEGAKTFVTNYDKLLDLEARIIELENTEKAIKKVIDLINSLPSPNDLTISDKALVEQARDEYESLNLEQKKEVTNLNLLEAAEAQMVIIEKNEQDKALAAEIVEMINNIPSIENLTIDDKTMLQNIRYKYGTLSDDAKAYVTNLEVLEKAEAQMELLKYIESLKTDAKYVDELIASLPSLEEVTLEAKARISNARTWYNRLSDDAKVYVTNLEKLKALEQKIVELEQIELYKEKATVVINLINALPGVNELTLDDQDAVVNVRNKYNALSATVKSYVTNLDVLEAVEAKLQDLIKNKEYEVFFYLDGGTLEGTTLVSNQLYKGIYKGMTTLGIPKKDGYLFVGFFTNANCTGEMISTVSDTITLYAGWIIDNSNLSTSEILNCVSDHANSYTKDSLVLENEEATFTWSTSNPNLYIIENGMGTISKVYQTHKEQTITVSVKITYKNGNEEEKSKQITVDPVLFEDLPSTPVATYFSVGAMYAYKQYNERYKLDGTIFSETTKEALDIVYYAFVVPNADGSCYLTDTSYLEEVKELKNHNVRIVACVNGVSTDTCKAFMTISADTTLRQKFVNNLMDLVEEYNLDGVDIDWESVSESVKVNATGMNNLMKDLREEMTSRQAVGGTPYFLSAAVPASSWGTASDRFDFVTLDKYVDYINIMSYDMNKTDTTTHLSPLYKSSYDRGYGFGCDYGVTRLTSLGLSRNKIIIGSAGYGKAYKVTGQSVSTTYPYLGVAGNLTQISGISGSFASGTLYGNAIEALIATGRYQKYTEYDNDKLVGSYLYSSVDGIFVTYDSEEAIIAKYQYAQSMEGVGIMCWCYSEDTSDTIINAIYKAMNM